LILIEFGDHCNCQVSALQALSRSDQSWYDYSELKYCKPKSGRELNYPTAISQIAAISAKSSKFIIAAAVISVSVLAFGVSGAPARADDPCHDAASSACLDAIKANPVPAVTPLTVDPTEVGAYSFYRLMPAAPIYDAPNGSVIGKVGDGFNFVGLYGTQAGYAKLRDGTWVPQSSLKPTTASQFSGVSLDQPLPFPMAWVIQSSIPMPVPGGSNNKKTPAILRYTRVYLYETVRVGQWDWYLVGPGQWLEQRKLARFMPVSRPDGVGTTDKWVSVNLYEQVLTAYEGDKPVLTTLISSGLPNWNTNVGTFKVWHRATLTPMSGAMGQPEEYSLPAVPWVQYFDNEISFHGTYWHDGFGFKHSHGCVNMSITDAHWLYNWAGDSTPLTVTVISGKTS
jgi:hypothetical protein